MSEENFNSGNSDSVKKGSLKAKGRKDPSGFKVDEFLEEFERDQVRRFTSKTRDLKKGVKSD